MSINAERPKVTHVWLIPVPGRAHPLLIPFEPGAASMPPANGVSPLGTGTPSDVQLENAPPAHSTNV